MNTQDKENSKEKDIVSYAFLPPVYLLCEVSLKVFGPFLNQGVFPPLLLSFKFFYILHKSPLQIFSPLSLGSVFHKAENFNFNEV